MTTVAQYLAACRAEIGYHETPVNLTKYAAMAHHPNGNPWCMTFQVAMARKTGLHLPYYGAYTPAAASAFKAAGHYGTHPRVGAYGFVYFPSMGRIGHVFVVEAVHSDGTITTIEGNSNADGSRTGGGVLRLHRSLYHITFGYPTYSLSATQLAPPPTTTTHPNPWPVPVLGTRLYISQTSHKSKAEVQYIQWAALGPAYDDGIWGTTTQKGVIAFQEHHGLKPDGEVGSKTLAVMKTIRR